MTKLRTIATPFMHNPVEQPVIVAQGELPKRVKRAIEPIGFHRTRQQLTTALGSYKHLLGLPTTHFMVVSSAQELRGKHKSRTRNHHICMPNLCLSKSRNVDLDTSTMIHDTNMCRLSIPTHLNTKPQEEINTLDAPGQPFRCSRPRKLPEQHPRSRQPWHPAERHGQILEEEEEGGAAPHRGQEKTTEASEECE